MNLELIATIAVFVGVSVGATILWVRTGLTSRITKNFANVIKNGDSNGTPGLLTMLVEIHRRQSDVIEKQGAMKQCLEDISLAMRETKLEVNKHLDKIDLLLTEHDARIRRIEDGHRRRDKQA